MQVTLTRLYVALWQHNHNHNNATNSNNNNNNNNNNNHNTAEHEVAVTFDKSRMKVHILEKLAASKLGAPRPNATHRFCLYLRTSHGNLVHVTSVSDVTNNDRCYLKVIAKPERYLEQNTTTTTTANASPDFCELLHSTFPKSGGSDMAVRASRRAQQQQRQQRVASPIMMAQPRTPQRERPDHVRSTTPHLDPPPEEEQPTTPRRQQMASSAVKAALAQMQHSDEEEEESDDENNSHKTTTMKTTTVKKESSTSPVRRSSRLSLQSPEKNNSNNKKKRGPGNHQHDDFETYEQQRKRHRRSKQQKSPKPPSIIQKSPKFSNYNHRDDERSVATTGHDRRSQQQQQQPERDDQSVVSMNGRRPGNTTAMTAGVYGIVPPPCPMGAKFFLTHFDGHEYPVEVIRSTADFVKVQFEYYNYTRTVHYHDLKLVTRQREQEWRRVLEKICHGNVVVHKSDETVVTRLSQRSAYKRLQTDEQREEYKKYGPHTDVDSLANYPVTVLSQVPMGTDLSRKFVRQRDRLVYFCCDNDSLRDICQVFPRVSLGKLLFDNQRLWPTLQVDCVLRKGTPLVLPKTFRGLLVANFGSPLELTVREPDNASVSDSSGGETTCAA